MNHEISLKALSDGMADAVEKAAVSTVLVDARQRMPASGTAIAGDLILTADHVVERDDEIRLLLPDGSEATAQVAGRDAGSDLAVLKIDQAVLTPATPVQSPARVGQLALALGRPDGDGVQASLGIVSAVGGPARTGRGMLESYLRTDAIPYPGFSGGPLIDATGAVLGINTSGLARGASLAIPAGVAWQIAKTLAEHGSIKRGYLGIRSQQVELPAGVQAALGREQTTGLLVMSVESGSPAEQSGLLVGDILAGMGGVAVQDHDDLLVQMNGTAVGQRNPAQVVRGGQLTEMPLLVGELQHEHRQHRRR